MCGEGHVMPCALVWQSSSCRGEKWQRLVKGHSRPEASPTALSIHAALLRRRSLMQSTQIKCTHAFIYTRVFTPHLLFPPHHACINVSSYVVWNILICTHYKCFLTVNVGLSKADRLLCVSSSEGSHLQLALWWHTLRHTRSLRCLENRQLQMD